MKRVVVVALCCAALTSAATAADVGMSIQFSQPGVFGRVDINQFPPPQAIVPQPVIIAPPPPAVPPPQPIYLWVPMEHRMHWEQYCGEYHACGYPVYFVSHVWYENNVLGRHRGERWREHEREHWQHGERE